MPMAVTLTMLFAAAMAATLPSGSWNIDPAESSVRFTVTKFGKEVVEGRFREFGGVVVYDDARPDRSAMQWNIRAASVETGHGTRDRVLRGPDFFDVARFPELTFAATRIRPLPDGRLHVRGTLTIRGTTRPVVVTARPVSSDRARPIFESHFSLDRHDFGVSGGSVTRHGISDRVDVHLRLVGVPR